MIHDDSRPDNRAFGLIAALACDGAIQAIFKQIFGTVTVFMPG
jgi:hypothetical protein